jgi:hypothetical protein
MYIVPSLTINSNNTVLRNIRNIHIPDNMEFSLNIISRKYYYTIVHLLINTSRIYRMAVTQFTFDNSSRGSQRATKHIFYY